MSLWVKWGDIMKLFAMIKAYEESGVDKINTALVADELLEISAHTFKDVLDEEFSE